MRYTLLPIGAALALIVTGCGPESPDPTGPDEAAVAFSHKPGHNPGGGEGGPPADPSVTVIYPAGAIASGFRIYGDAPDGSGTYTNGDCGVYSRLFVGGSGDAVMDPDTDYKKGKDGDCLPADPDWDTRHIVLDASVCVFPVDCGGPYGIREGAWFMNVNDVHAIDVLNTPAVVPAQFNAGGCALGLKFRASYSTPDVEVSEVEVTLIGTSPRRWRVRSVAPHIAVCVPDGQGGQSPPLRYFALPFELELEEVAG